MSISTRLLTVIYISSVIFITFGSPIPKESESEEKKEEQGPIDSLLKGTDDVLAEVTFDAKDKEFQQHIMEINEKIKEFGRNVTDFTNVNFKPVNLFEALPADFLCEFCMSVIGRLKEKQIRDGDKFEEEMKEGCWAINRTKEDDGNVCELVNKVNLDRLKNSATMKICAEEKFCVDKDAILAEIQRLREERKRKEREVETEMELQRQRRREVEEAKKQLEAIERAKEEAARKEYMMWQDGEMRKQREKARIHVFNGRAEDDKDVEYIADEVSMNDVDKNDYLDQSKEKSDTIEEEQSKTMDESAVVKGKGHRGEAVKGQGQGSVAQIIEGQSVTVSSPHKEESIHKKVKKLNRILDRTVTMKMDVQDP